MRRRPSICRACDLPVLDFVGQHVFFDSYEVQEEWRETPAADLWGEWHIACLATKPDRIKWSQWRLKRMTWQNSHSYALAAQVEGWSILTKGGKRFAWSSDCEWIPLSEMRRPARRAPGGLLFRQQTPVVLEVEDRELIAELGAELTENGHTPLHPVLEYLGLLEHLRHPETFAEAELVWDRRLARQWSARCLLVMARYDVFLPEVLRPYLPRGALK